MNRRMGWLLLGLGLWIGCSTSPISRHEDGGALDAGVDGGPDAGPDAGPRDGGGDGGADGGSGLCDPADDLTCSTHEWEPVVGICQTDGICFCTGFEYFLDESTGRCRWGECDMVAQDCPRPGDGCYPPGDGLGYPHCLPAGPTRDGAACLTSPECTRGATCELGTRVCARMCDPDASTCAPGQDCLLVWARRGMPGLCL